MGSHQRSGTHGAPRSLNPVKTFALVPGAVHCRGEDEGMLVEAVPRYGKTGAGGGTPLYPAEHSTMAEGVLCYKGFLTLQGGGGEGK